MVRKRCGHPISELFNMSSDLFTQRVHTAIPREVGTVEEFIVIFPPADSTDLLSNVPVHFANFLIIGCCSFVPGAKG